MAGDSLMILIRMMRLPKLIVFPKPVVLPPKWWNHSATSLLLKPPQTQQLFVTRWCLGCLCRKVGHGEVQKQKAVSALFQKLSRAASPNQPRSDPVTEGTRHGNPSAPSPWRPAWAKCLQTLVGSNCGTWSKWRVHNWIFTISIYIYVYTYIYN